MSAIFRLPLSHLLLFGSFFFILYGSAFAAYKRCYVCNSRGPMGDCKDSFYHNSTVTKTITEIEERPCPSGWCGKSVQIQETEAILQTVRFCLQRPPSDGVERCAQTMLGEHGGQARFMCFCKGDLCNGTSATFPTLLVSIFTVIFIIGRRLLQ